MDLLGFPIGSDDKESAVSAGDLGLRESLPTVIFMPEEFHGQRSLEGYSPWRSQRVRHDLATNTSSW